MPKYHAIEQPLAIKTSLSDLIALTWEALGIRADFAVPEDELRAITVRFDRTHVVRILDEMALSTEAEDTPSEGLLAEHFAYLVEDSSFWKSQSEALKLVHSNARHYRFVTGWTCLDVVSDEEPVITVTTRKPDRS
ncbi:hypothetical protein [Bradyrhizobium manausense]|uniref:hypothetical protein n=1 Tax=Bradyrhizobium manausense TaxID=989370 RepID=UPI0020126F51|nr:hypothetical protein [Bradyrhizobium manausense]